jgi:hypothetical protein
MFALALAVASVALAAISLAGAVYSWHAMRGTDTGRQLSMVCGQAAALAFTMAVAAMILALSASP